MAEGRGRQSWAHTSAILALIANVNRDPKKTRALRPSDFDPFAKRPAPIPIDMDSLKAVFLEGRFPRTPDRSRGQAADPGTEDNSCGCAT